MQLFTQLTPTLFNELQAGYTDNPISGRRTPSPLIRAGVTPAAGVGSSQLSAGVPANGQAGGASQVAFEAGDHLLLHAGRDHLLGLGAHLEGFSYRIEGVRGALGQWTFRNLDDLAAGRASAYTITSLAASATGALRGLQWSAYVNDDWQVSNSLSLTLGLRVDALAIRDRPADNPVVLGALGLRTTDYPAGDVQWSPRLGFTWEPGGDQRTAVRGGAGYFVGRPPLGWLLQPLRSTGAGVRTLTCPASTAPAFVASVTSPPQSCTDGSGFADGPVARAARDLRMARSFRASLAVDRQLSAATRASVVGIYSRQLSDFLFLNDALRGPQGVDAQGRVLYGAIAPTTADPSPAWVDSRFPEVIGVRSHPNGNSWSLTAQVERSFAAGLELHAAYTHARARDVQSLISASPVAPFDIWASARASSGRQDDFSTGVSSFDIPHRVVLSVTRAAHWWRYTTDVSLVYVGESGAPFTYGDSSTSRLGDLNADGTSANDPIYVPRDATDPAEIAFAGSDSAARAQGAAFERFIRGTACLRRQRGAIVSRNSCRAPWVNTSNLSLRQSLPSPAGHHATLELAVFDLLNLLHASWGLLEVPAIGILQPVAPAPGSTQRRFQFDAAHVKSHANLDSGYQLQLSLRYSF